MLSFKIHGMDCAEEVTVLKHELAPLVGGEEQLAFDILNGKLIVMAGAVYSYMVGFSLEGDSNER